MSQLYFRFGNGFTQNHTFTEQDLLDLYNYETFGVPLKSNNKNGYALGKKIMDITISMWREDISNGHLFVPDLYREYPSWWLDKILKNITPKIRV